MHLIPVSEVNGRIFDRIRVYHRSTVVLVDRSAPDQDPTMIGQVHRKCVEKLSALRKNIDNEKRHVESRQPLVCAETLVPQPDFCLINQ